MMRYVEYIRAILLAIGFLTDRHAIVIFYVCIYVSQLQNTVVMVLYERMAIDNKHCEQLRDFPFLANSPAIHFSSSFRF